MTQALDPADDSGHCASSPTPSVACSASGRVRPQALGPLARLLLRTESIASSKAEKLQFDARDLACGEARAAIGGKLNATTAEVLTNTDAMELAIDEATSAERFGPDQIVAIHRQLLIAAPNASVAGRIGTCRTGSAATSTTPAVPTPYPHLPGTSNRYPPRCSSHPSAWCSHVAVIATSPG